MQIIDVHDIYSPYVVHIYNLHDTCAISCPNILLRHARCTHTIFMLLDPLYHYKLFNYTSKTYALTLPILFKAANVLSIKSALRFKVTLSSLKKLHVYLKELTNSMNFQITSSFICGLKLPRPIPETMVFSLMTLDLFFLLLLSIQAVQLNGNHTRLAVKR